MGFYRKPKKKTDNVTQKSSSRLASGLVKLILGTISFFIYLIAFLIPTQLVLVGAVPFFGAYFLPNTAELGAIDVLTMYVVAGVCLFAWYEIYKLTLKVAHRIKAWTEAWILEGRLDQEKVD